MSKLDNTLLMLRYHLDTAEHRLVKFQQELATNPLSAFEWSQPAVEAAGVKAVYTRVIDYIGMYEDETDEERLDGAYHMALRETVSFAQQGSASASEMTNVARRARERAWALVTETLAGAVGESILKG